MLPLSAGPVAGLMVNEPPGPTLWLLYVKVGAAFAVIVIFRAAVAVALPSLACRVKLAVVAPQPAMRSAVTLPLLLTMFETVTPFAGLALVTVTVALPAPLSAPPTVAICEFEPGE